MSSFKSNENIHKKEDGSYYIVLANKVALHCAGCGCSIGCASAWYADGHGFNPNVWQNILSLRFGQEKISMTILSLPLIQEGQLSVTGKRMGTKY